MAYVVGGTSADIRRLSVDRNDLSFRFSGMYGRDRNDRISKFYVMVLEKRTGAFCGRHPPGGSAKRCLPPFRGTLTADGCELMRAMRNIKEIMTPLSSAGALVCAWSALHWFGSPSPLSRQRDAAR